MHANPEKIEVGKTDQSEDKARRLHAFRERLAARRMVDFWSNADDLCTKVVIAVGQSVNLKPGVGWIRGDQAVDPKVLQDLERLRAENERLRQELVKLNGSEITFPDELPSPDDPVNVNYTISSKSHAIRTTWRELFLASSEGILHEQTKALLQTLLLSRSLRKVFPSRRMRFRKSAFN